MKKLIATLVLGAVAMCLVTAPLFATTTNNKWQVIEMTANADSTGAVPASVAPGRVVRAIRVVPTESSKYYKLHVGTSSGNVLWKTLTTVANTAQDWNDATIPVPAAGLAVSTNDTTPTIYLYLENSRND